MLSPLQSNVSFKFPFSKNASIRVPAVALSLRSPSSLLRFVQACRYAIQSSRSVAVNAEASRTSIVIPASLKNCKSASGNWLGLTVNLLTFFRIGGSDEKFSRFRKSKLGCPGFFFTSRKNSLMIFSNSPEDCCRLVTSSFGTSVSLHQASNESRYRSLDLRRTVGLWTSGFPSILRLSPPAFIPVGPGSP